MKTILIFLSIAFFGKAVASDHWSILETTSNQHKTAILHVKRCVNGTVKKSRETRKDNVDLSEEELQAIEEFSGQFSDIFNHWKKFRWENPPNILFSQKNKIFKSNNLDPESIEIHYIISFLDFFIERIFFHDSTYGFLIKPCRYTTGVVGDQWIPSFKETKGGGLTFLGVNGFIFFGFGEHFLKLSLDSPFSWSLCIFSKEEVDQFLENYANH